MKADDGEMACASEHSGQSGSADRLATERGGMAAPIAEKTGAENSAIAAAGDAAPAAVEAETGPRPGAIGTDKGAAEASAGHAEESGAKVDSATAALRIGMIALLAASVGALGISQSRILPDIGAAKIIRSIAGKRGPDLRGFPLLDGDVALASETMVINGSEVDAVRCTSMLEPDALVAAYSRLLRERGWTGGTAPVRGGDRPAESPVPFGGKGQSMLGFRDPKGSFAGIVAFSNRTRGGSDYFLVRDSPGAPPQDALGHVPGREPPGVPVPANSTREYCIERRGDSPSMMVLYSSPSPAPIAASRVAAQMEEQGWSETAAAREALAATGDNRPMLFTKGNEQLLLSVAPADEGPGSWITVVYRKSMRE